jgi:hypothetical protein
VPSITAIATVRVKVIGNAPESREAARAAVKRSFAKTHAFYGTLPRFDDGLPSLATDADVRRAVSVRDVTYVSEGRDRSQQAQVPPVARPDATPAQAPEELHNELDERRLLQQLECETADRTTLRVKALEPQRTHRLWQRQTPLVAFGIAASFCIVCLLVVNLLNP